MMIMGIAIVVGVGGAAVQMVRGLRHAHLVLVPRHWEAILAPVAVHRRAALDRFPNALNGHVDHEW